MSGNGLNGAEKDIKSAPPVRRIIITLSADGELDVQAPLGDKLLCFGMLKAAELVVASYKAPQQGSGLVVAPASAGKLVREPGA